MRLDCGKRLHDFAPKREAAVAFSGVVCNHPDLTLVVLDQVQGEHLLASHERRIALMTTHQVVNVEMLLVNHPEILCVLSNHALAYPFVRMLAKRPADRHRRSGLRKFVFDS